MRLIFSCNDPQAREMFRDSGIVRKPDHMRWLERALADRSRFLFMADVEERSAGIARFDNRGDDVFEVSINIKPDMRGKKIGTALLRRSMRALAEMRRVKKFVAEIKESNGASLAIFQKNGFRIVPGEPAGEFLRLEYSVPARAD